MKKSILLTLAVSALISSCGAKKNVGASQTYRKGIVLGAFADISKQESTFDESLLKDLPKIVNFSDKMTAVKNQSNRGTCAIFSTMGLVENAIKKDLNKDVNLSEEFLNFKSKDLGYFPEIEGTNVSYNLSTIKRAGVLLEKDLSYEPSYFDKGLECEKFKAGASDTPRVCYSHKKPSKDILDKVINANNIEYNSISKDTNEIIKFLATEQRGLTISLLVNYDGWLDSGETFYNENLRTVCLRTPSPCGAHSVVLTGYDLNKKVFFFKNSWGNMWGMKGFGTVSFETVDQYVESDLYYVKVKSLNIPADHDKDQLIVENFSFENIINKDKSLEIKVTGAVRNTLGRFLYVSSFMSEKPKSVQEATNDLNSGLVNLSDRESALVGEKFIKATAYFESSKNLSWTAQAPLMLGLSSQVMSLESVKNNTKKNSDFELLLRTTIYVHTDTDKFKVLNRVFLPLAI